MPYFCTILSNEEEEEENISNSNNQLFLIKSFSSIYVIFLDFFFKTLGNRKLIKFPY